MLRSQAVPADVTADRDARLRFAEQEVTSAEAQLQQEALRLQSAAGELLGRLQQVKAAASQAQLSGVRAPGFAELHQRVHQTQVGGLDVSGHRERALEARARAVEARRQVAEELRQAIQAHAAELSRLSSQLTADEVALARLEAEQHKAASAPPPPLPRSEPATLPAAPVQVPRPQGRRAQPRVRMQAAVDLHSDSNFFTGFSTNISEGGLFVATVQMLPLGTEVDLGFSLPGGKKVTVKGVVRWTREVNDQTPEIFPGVGIQFVDLDPQVAGALQQFVSAREPLFFPE